MSVCVEDCTCGGNAAGRPPATAPPNRLAYTGRGPPRGRHWEQPAVRTQRRVTDAMLCVAAGRPTAAAVRASTGPWDARCLVEVRAVPVGHPTTPAPRTACQGRLGGAVRGVEEINNKEALTEWRVRCRRGRKKDPYDAKQAGARRAGTLVEHARDPADSSTGNARSVSADDVQRRLFRFTNARRLRHCQALLRIVAFLDRHRPDYRGPRALRWMPNSACMADPWPLRPSGAPADGPPIRPGAPRACAREDRKQRQERRSSTLDPPVRDDAV